MIVYLLKIKRGTCKSCLGHSYRPPKTPNGRRAIYVSLRLQAFHPNCTLADLADETKGTWSSRWSNRYPACFLPARAFSQCVDHLIGGGTKITHVLLWYLWPCDWQRCRVDWSINNWGNKRLTNVNIICLTSSFQGNKIHLWLVCLAWISVKLCISFLLREKHIHLVGYLLWYYHTKTILFWRKFIPVNLKEESEMGVFHFHPMAVIIKSNIHSSCW